MKKAGSKIKYKPSVPKESQSSGEPTEEEIATGRPKLQQKNSIGSDDGSKSRRKKSYLPRKSVKAQKEKSKELKGSVNSSLDKFLQLMSDAPPIKAIKDDNRSVFSDLLDTDRRRRVRNLKEGEKISRRITRDAPSQRGVEQNNSSTSNDSMSVVSFSMITSKQARSYLEDSNCRPVVNLKQTQFSKKLHKLHVAF
jgi:hypothetical protein